jgi:DNA-binding LacI/PurR family transcriptional regulator
VRALTAGLRALPAVFVGGLAGASEADAPAVGTDQLTGAREATRHLLELGHRTVHHLAGPQDWLDGRWRVEGWREALRTAGAEEPELVEGDWSARSGYVGMREMLAADPTLTAVFAANDQMALGALRALDEVDRRVPDDVSIVGFDDIPEAEFFSPPLTTVRQHFAESGQLAVHLLLGLIRPEDAAAGAAPPPLVPTELIIRRSSGPPPT